MQVIHHACLIPIIHWLMVTPSTQVLSIFLGTMSLVIGRKTGISTGILILLTKICHGSSSTKQASIHFVSTSTRASVPEQFQGIKEIIEWVAFNLQTLRSLIETRETHCAPVKVRNASNGLPMRFRIYCNCTPRDNPSQSKTSGHIRGNENHLCRKCELGGTQKAQETDNGFHASFSICAWTLVCILLITLL